MTQDATAGGALQLITFRLGGERYGLGLEAVEEVADAARLRRRSDLPGDLCGEVEVRGAMVPVVDLGSRLGLETGEGSGRRVLISRAGGAGRVGVLVGEVQGVRQVPAGSLAPAPRYFERSGEILRGITRLEEGLTVVLDAGRLLAGEVGEALRRWEEEREEAAPA